jgi:glycosyltransferase involved in cell wall biosynthesis
MKFSVIIVTYNRKKEFFACLESLEKQASPHLHEVICVFNGDHSYHTLARQRFPNYKFLSISRTTPSEARNFATTFAHGDYLLFLDDDCFLPDNYFQKVDFSKNWDVLGGPDKTPPHSSNLQRSTGLALQSPLCMGPTYHRHSQTKKYLENVDESFLILCNLWFKREIFSNEGYAFSLKLFRSEENFLLKELKMNSKVLHYDPELFVYHQRKNNLENLASSIIKSGECRIQNMLMLPNIRELIYLAPLIFLCLLLLSIFHPTIYLSALFLSYALAIMIYSFYKYRNLTLHYVFLHFFILNFYAIGLIKGMLSCLMNSYTAFRLNRSNQKI